jgi:ferritin-like protein
MIKQEKEEIVEELVIRLRDGDVVYDIIEDYVENGLTEARVRVLLKMANAEIKKEADYIRNNILDLHLARYEGIYALNIKVKDMVSGYGDESENIAKPYILENNYKTISYKLGTAFNALKSKEKLMGLSDKGVKIIISETKTEIVNDKTKIDLRGFNMGNLSTDELYELRELLDQCRINPLEGIYPLEVKHVSTTIVFEQKEDDLLDSADMSSPIEDFTEQFAEDIEFKDLTEEEGYNKKLDIIKEKSGNMARVKDGLNASFLKLAKEKFK